MDPRPSAPTMRSAVKKPLLPFSCVMQGTALDATHAHAGPVLDPGVRGGSKAQRFHQRLVPATVSEGPVAVGQEAGRGAVVGKHHEALAAGVLGDLARQIDAELAQHLDRRGVEPLARQAPGRARIGLAQRHPGTPPRMGQGRDRADRPGADHRHIVVSGDARRHRPPAMGRGRRR